MITLVPTPSPFAAVEFSAVTHGCLLATHCSLERKKAILLFLLLKSQWNSVTAKEGKELYNHKGEGICLVQTTPLGMAGAPLPPTWHTQPEPTFDVSIKEPTVMCGEQELRETVS